MSHRHWMPLYIGDYLSETSHLTAAEHGAYMLLLMAYWSKGSLPDDDRALARIARMTPAEWSESAPVIRELFEPGMRHPRLDEELSRAEAAHARRVEAGRKGGRPRKVDATPPAPEPRAVEVVEPVNDNPENQCFPIAKAGPKQPQSQPQPDISTVREEISFDARETFRDYSPPLPPKPPLASPLVSQPNKVEFPRGVPIVVELPPRLAARFVATNRGA